SRRLLVGMLPPRFGDDIQPRRRRASRAGRRLVTGRKVPGDDGVERSIILLVLFAIAEGKRVGLALGKQYTRRAPGARIGQLVRLVPIDRARLAVRIPRARHAVPMAGGKCGLKLREIGRASCRERVEVWGG